MVSRNVGVGSSDAPQTVTVPYEDGDKIGYIYILVTEATCGTYQYHRPWVHLLTGRTRYLISKTGVDAPQFQMLRIPQSTTATENQSITAGLGGLPPVEKLRKPERRQRWRNGRI
jgi:hypothetical protein